MSTPFEKAHRFELNWDSIQANSLSTGRLFTSHCLRLSHCVFAHFGNRDDQLHNNNNVVRRNKDTLPNRGWCIRRSSLSQSDPGLALCVSCCVTRMRDRFICCVPPLLHNTMMRTNKNRRQFCKDLYPPFRHPPRQFYCYASQGGYCRLLVCPGLVCYGGHIDFGFPEGRRRQSRPIDE